MFPSARYYSEFEGNVLPVRPFGLYLNVTSTLVEADETLADLNPDFTPVEPREYRYEGFVEGVVASGFWAKSPVAFTLPKAQPDGFFSVGSTLFLFANVGFPDPWQPLKHGEYHFLTKSQVALRVMENMFGSSNPNIPNLDVIRGSYGAFSNFFFQSRPGKIAHVNNEHLQSLMLSRLVQHPFVRQVQNTPLQVNGTKDLVILHPRRDGVKVDPKKFNENHLKALDPCSTSSSETVNCVYQLSQGAKIENGRLKKGRFMLCEFTRDNSVFLSLNPSRAYLARAAVMNSAYLTDPQERPISSRDSVVQTRNLMVAVMDLGHATFEDCIAMSSSCALNFEAQSVTRITRWTKDPITDLRVQKNDIVRPFGVLAVNVVTPVNIDSLHDVDRGVQEDEETPHKVVLVATELKEDSVLEDIEITPSWYAGQSGYKTTFVFRSFLPMRTGDKITCFSGSKGVVIILPDEKMPVIRGRRADICISPNTVFKRGTIGLLLEGAVGRAYEKGELKHISAHGDESPVDMRWALMNYRRKDVAYLDGMKLPHKVSWGIVPWMRILKSGIASRRMSAVGTERPLTGEGLLPDTAATAGQKMDPSKALVLASRGMTNTLAAILGDSPAGLDILSDTVAAIDEPSHANE